MAIKSLALVVAAGAEFASANFGLFYPSARTDTLKSGDPSISQWTYPCAGIDSNVTGNNVTDWPITGGRVVLDLHDEWEYIFINLGLAPGDGSSVEEVTNFNISLTPQFLNATGKGVLCLPELGLPGSLRPAEGSRGTVQVVAVGADGGARYNCADVRFTTAESAVLNCSPNPNIPYYPVRQQTAGDGSGSGNKSSSGEFNNSTAGTVKNAGLLAGVDRTALAAVVGLAVTLVCGLGF